MHGIAFNRLSVIFCCSKSPVSACRPWQLNACATPACHPWRISLSCNLVSVLAKYSMANHSFLLVGDSRVAGYKELLGNSLHKRGVFTEVVTMPGAQLETIKTKTVEELIRHGKYDLCLIAGGMNDITDKSHTHGADPCYTFHHNRSRDFYDTVTTRYYSQHCRQH